jgi:heme/copper-type cytochrome/quinol oxidase subunit 3
MMRDASIDFPADTPAAIAPHEEEGLAVSAAIGAMWTGSRLLIGACTFLFGGFAFAFFYLRSLNSHGMWHPDGQQPSVIIGTTAVVLVVASAVMHNAGLRRLRAGLNLDWRVAALTSLGLGVAGIGLEVWELTRLDFFPGASGFASVFVGFTPVYIILGLGAMYWLETIIARGLRVRNAWAGEGGLGSSITAEATRLRASLDAFNYFWSYLALVGVGFWILFYVVS